MIFRIIDFLVDYFTNIGAKKIFAGILVLAGLTVMGQAGRSGDPSWTVLYVAAGIVLGGIGIVVIYYDIAKDRIGHRYDELHTLTHAYKQKEREEKQATA